MSNHLQEKTLSNWGKHVVATLTMLVGPILVFGMVLVMNKMEFGTDRNLTQEVSEVAVIKNDPIKQDSPVKKVTEKPKPKANKPSRASAPIPQLNASLSGVDFGLDLGGGEAAGNSQQAGADKLVENRAVTTTDEAADVFPQPKVKSAFIYPKSAKSKGVTGYVALSVLVAVDGSVSKVEIEESSPQGVFDDAVLAGIQNWHFTPGMQQGKPAPMWVKQKIRFSLE